MILSYKVRENTALLLCTSNQVGTGHKLHFQPKHPARAKLAAINNKNGGGRKSDKGKEELGKAKQDPGEGGSDGTDLRDVLQERRTANTTIRG